MFEQMNNFQVTRNEREGGNKLMAHFQNSTFLAQQQELSMFIKDMPIIRIEEVQSLNKLIEVLIKQNEVLGGECQQHVLTVKEMFSKHEELMRANRQLQQQLADYNRQIQYNNVNQQQIDSFQQQLAKTKSELTMKQQTLGELKNMTEQLMELNKSCQSSMQEVGQVLKLMLDKNFKRCYEKIKELIVGENKHLDWVDWEGLERFVKEEKKKAKFFPKIKETVEMFCSRFMKISEYVSGQMIKEEFTKEVSNLLQILDDLLLLKRKNSVIGSQSRLIGSQSRLTDYHPDCNFFEGLLDKILKDRDINNATRQEISMELMSVKQELQDCKGSYQQYIIAAKMQCEETLRRKEEELVEKNHLLLYYEEEKEKNTRSQMEMKNKITQVEQAIKVQRLNAQIKGDQNASLQARLQSVKSQSTLRENEVRAQWDQNIKTFEYKLLQKQELLEEEQKQRKSLKADHQQQMTQLKLKIGELEESDRTLGLRGKQLQSSNQQLSSIIQKMQKKAEEELLTAQKQISEKSNLIQELTRKREKELQQIKTFREDMQDNEKEKSLQSAYIKELENKNKDIVGKLKATESKKNDDKTAKKEMSAIKQTVIEEKKYSRQVEETLQSKKQENHRQKEENQRLKGLIKQMKRQLQQVYHQFNQLKMIESDRQKLIVDMQRSDRTREELMRSYQLQKTQMVRLEQQNKALALEAKHYKSALGRIEALRY